MARPAREVELFKQFMDNESFRKWMTDTVFGLTFEPPRPRPAA
jgi:type I restriction enzyme, R subunit